MHKKIFPKSKSRLRRKQRQSIYLREISCIN